MKKSIMLGLVLAVSGMAAVIAGPVSARSSGPLRATAHRCHWQQAVIVHRRHVSCRVARRVVDAEYTAPSTAPWKCRSLPPDYAHGRCHRGRLKSFRWH